MSVVALIVSDLFQTKGLVDAKYLRKFNGLGDEEMDVDEVASIIEQRLPKWIPVTVQLPPENPESSCEGHWVSQPVLITDGKLVQLGCVVVNGGGHFPKWEDVRGMNIKATHWQPLPEIP